MTRVLAVASEVFPFVKTGGLADVVGALPAAVAGEGVDMRVMVPGYRAVLSALRDHVVVHEYKDLFGGPASLLAANAGGVPLIVVEAAHLYDRPGNPYLGPDGADWLDNWKRFAALSYAAADVGSGAIAAFLPDVVHAHDWQAALAAAYLHFNEVRHARTVVTVHNLAFQGQFSSAIFPELRLPPQAFAIAGVEYYGGVGYLKGGLQFADAITTVSPSYAEEICTPAGGMGLDGLLRARRDVLSGIVNGIDTDTWNPETDADLAAPFGVAKLAPRLKNKRELEKRFALDADDRILFCIVSRLTWQKGMDLFGSAVDELVASGARLAVLGAGDAALEGMFRAAAARYPGRVGVVNAYNESLSHLLQGGSDAILIPSRFEPCGLTQFYGLRYGCVPVVARVGGLADTIIDANDAAVSAGVATGIQFFPVEAVTLDRAIERTIALYQDKKTWGAIQRRGMRSDVSWRRSAHRYAGLYRQLTTSGE